MNHAESETDSEKVNVRGSGRQGEQGPGDEQKAGRSADHVSVKGRRRGQADKPGRRHGVRGRRPNSDPYSKSYAKAKEEEVLRRYRIKVGSDKPFFCDSYQWQPPWLTIVSDRTRRTAQINGQGFEVVDLMPQAHVVTSSPAIVWNTSSSSVNQEPVATGGIADFRRKQLEAAQTLGPTFRPLDE